MSGASALYQTSSERAAKGARHAGRRCCAHIERHDDVVDVLLAGRARRLLVEALRVQLEELAQLDLPILVTLVHGVDEIPELLIGRVLPEAPHDRSEIRGVDGA